MAIAGEKRGSDKDKQKAEKVPYIHRAFNRGRIELRQNTFSQLNELRGEIRQGHTIHKEYLNSPKG
jgi:hypothetical protein